MHRDLKVGPMKTIWRNSMQWRVQDFGREGSNKYIHTSGGRAYPVIARGTGGALLAPPVGYGA